MVTFTPAATAPPYEAPLHYGVAARRLQGLEASDTEVFWIGLSVYEPGGRADESPTREETVYVVLDGSLTVTTEGQDYVLGQHDSLHLPKGTVRNVVNHTDSPTTMLVAIANLREA